VGCRDEVGLDLDEHFRVQVERRLRRQPTDRVAETRVAVAATEVVAGAGELEAAFQARLVRVLPDRVFVVREGFTPAVLDFQPAALAEQFADLGHATRCKGGPGKRDLVRPDNMTGDMTEKKKRQHREPQ
jgi:hypothetical protein